MLHAKQHTEHIGVEGGRITFGSLFRYRTWLSFGTGVVDGYVKPAEPGHGLFDQVAHVVFVTHVGVNEFGLAAQIPQLGYQRLSLGLLAARNNQTGPILRKSQRGRPADTGQGASNQDNGSAHSSVLQGMPNGDWHL